MMQSHRESPGPADEIVAVAKVHKRRRPPPAASIVRAPSYMTNPKLAKSTNNSTASSSSSSSTSTSTSSSDPSTESPVQTWQTPALGFYHPNGTIKFENGNTPQQGMIHSSSPDPLSLPLPSFTDGVEGRKQGEKRVVNDIFLDHEPLLPSMGEDVRDRDPLIPDAPLWYTYNQQSPPT
jgi:hypothetical protein